MNAKIKKIVVQKKKLKIISNCYILYGIKQNLLE